MGCAVFTLESIHYTFSGSKALQKVVEAVEGFNSHNIADLVSLDGNIVFCRNALTALIFQSSSLLPSLSAHRRSGEPERPAAGLHAQEGVLQVIGQVRS